MADPENVRPPGWYDGPAGPATQRWWDGQRWAPPGGGPTTPAVPRTEGASAPDGSQPTNPSPYPDGPPPRDDSSGPGGAFPGPDGGRPGGYPGGPEAGGHAGGQGPGGYGGGPGPGGYAGGPGPGGYAGGPGQGPPGAWSAPYAGAWPAPYPGAWNRRPGPPVLIEVERTGGNRARLGLVIGAVAYAVSLGAQAFYLHEFWVAFDKALTAASRPGATSATIDPTISLSSSATTAQSIGQIASFATFAVGVVFLVWFHRALTNAAGLGLPARRTPGWGVAGFIIPIVNFWFPYQSACDLFPPGHPARKLVGRWWAFWLTAQLLTIGVVFAAVASVAAGIASAAIVTALYALAAVTGRDMIQQSAEVHAELAAQLTQPWMGPGPTAPDPRFGPYPTPGAVPPEGPPAGGGWPPSPEAIDPSDRTVPPQDSWRNN